MDKRIWPTDISAGDNYTGIEKKVYSVFSNNEMSAWFLVDIDPVGFSNEKVRMAAIVSANDGIVTLSLHEDVDPSQFVVTVDLYTDMIEGKIYDLLLESAALISKTNDKKILKMPYKHINVFRDLCGVENERCISLDSLSTKEEIQKLFCTGKCKPYTKSFCTIDDAEAIAIISKIAPEYTVIKPQVVKNEVDESSDDINVEELPAITGREIEYSTFLLDEDQVKYVNEMGTGHRVLLANAGAGKSVLLLSRAYRYASTHKSGKVLITCFNNNLADSYKFKNSCSNFGDNNNLFIMTFHKLVKKIYNECLKSSIAGEYPTEQEIQDLLLYIKKGMVNLKFTAIFIDEVQIFTPLYLDICYALLDSNKDAVFLLAGDLNQAVRKQSRKGDAPWKKIDGGKLNFRGRVKYISKNYRNSPQISSYLNAMLAYMNLKLSQNGLIDMQEFDYNIFGDGPAQNIALEVQRRISRMDICGRIIGAIEEITNKYKVGYSDIAVLFPYKENRFLKYHILFWITSEMKKRGIQYSLIFSDDQEERSQYSRTNGVVLSTIDSSLGLDFRAVILAGLYPYEYIYTEDKKTKKINGWEQLSKLPSDEQESVKVQLRKLYTACSRAREVLYVLSDIEEGSPFDDVLEDRSK